MLDSTPYLSLADDTQAGLTRSQTSKKSIGSLASTVEEARIDDGLPGPPANVAIAQIRQDSFTVTWDAGDNAAAVDYELRYCHDVDGKDTQVVDLLSRWCLKDPVPRGRHVVEDLEPSTEYRDVALRGQSAAGWSKFSRPIELVVTASKGEGAMSS